jgi:DNA-binding MarR family transcriptional regulator
MQHANDASYLLQHVASLLAKHSDQILQEQLGIGYAQLKLLLTLQSKPELKQRDIAHGLGQTEASISRQVKLMIRQGLLHVTINPKNRREHLATVTAKGMNLTDAALAVLQKSHQSMYVALGSKGQEQLSELLDQLHAQVCEVTTSHLARLSMD